jgi:hypothetical protein
MMQQQDRQQRPRLLAAQPHQPVTDPNLERTEDPKVHFSVVHGPGGIMPDPHRVVHPTRELLQTGDVAGFATGLQHAKLNMVSQTICWTCG